MGAGVIPVVVYDGEVLFLFQKTFTGRKVGTLIDFGGGLGDGEDYQATAIREFVEETETMYFEDDLSRARRTEDRISRQIREVEHLFEQTLSTFPHWWRKRQTINPAKPKDWRTFFIRFPHRDITEMNKVWEIDTSGRFKKRRELQWVGAEQLIDMYTNSPDNLWKRVRELEQAVILVREIQANLLSDNQTFSN